MRIIGDVLYIGQKVVENDGHRGCENVIFIDLIIFTS
jgi:hypothetical protein